MVATAMERHKFGKARDLDAERRIVVLCQDGRSYRKVGAELGITGERVRQVWTRWLAEHTHEARNTGVAVSSRVR